MIRITPMRSQSSSSRSRVLGRVHSNDLALQQRHLISYVYYAGVRRASMLDVA
jgi:hypothetical protein